MTSPVTVPASVVALSADRLGADIAGDADPRAAAIVGAVFVCVQAARASWLGSDRAGVFDQVLDKTMGVLAVHHTP